MSQHLIGFRLLLHTSVCLPWQLSEAETKLEAVSRRAADALEAARMDMLESADAAEFEIRMALGRPYPKPSSANK